MKRRKDNWIGHILAWNCLEERDFEGKIEGRIGIREGRGRGRKQLLNDLQEKRGCWSLKEEALDRTVWGTRFVRGCGSVVKTDYLTNEFLFSLQRLKHTVCADSQ
jgi:hypothetical protein